MAAKKKSTKTVSPEQRANEPEFVCDGFAGDIDRVYQVEEIG